jgi:PAS domain S-box-containing protein
MRKNEAVQGSLENNHLLVETARRKKVEDVLHVNGESCRALLEAIRGVIYVATPDGTITYVSPQVSHFGYTPDEIIGHRIFEFIMPEDAERVAADLQQCLATGKESSLEFRIVKRDGSFFYAEESDKFIREGDRIVGLVGVILDVSEHRRAKAALEESEAKYRSLVETVPGMIYTLDKNGNFTSVNAYSLERLGYRREEIIGRHFTWVIHPEDRKMILELFAKAVAGKRQKPGKLEFRILTKEGQVIWVSLNASVTFDADGNVLQEQGVASDITEQKRAKDALRESEEKYRTLIERASDGICIIQDGLVKYLNLRLAEMWGGSVDEVTGTPFIDYVYPDERRKVVEYYKRRMVGEAVPGIYETVLRRKDGSKVYVELNAGTVSYQGKAADFVFVREITARKQVEEALRAREREHQVILDTVPVGIFHLDTSGRFIHVNKALAERYGMKPEDFKGKTTRELFPAAADEYIQSDREVIACGEPQIGIARKLRTPEGLGWVRLDKVPLKDRDGNVTGLIGSELDITQRMQAQEELRDAHKKTQDIIEFLPDATFVIDSDMKVIAWNRAIEEMTGIQKGDIIGKGDYEYSIPFYGERRPILTDLIFLRNKEIESRYTRVEKKGDTLFAEVYSPFMYQGRGAHLWGVATPLFDRKGNVVGAIESIRDITDHKRAEEERKCLIEELEKKNREMERFAYTVSHDLRSPLITIQGFTSMLRKDLTESRTEQMDADLQYIERAASKMDKLLSMTLKLSRIGRLVNPPEDVPFGAIVEGALAQTAGDLQAHAINVAVAEDFPTVRVDRMRIEELLVNLITNSVKYRGESPHPKIEIGHRVDGEEIVFFVKDNGIGIDKSEQDKVFELFYRVDKSGEGTGAGLAIVKRIIEVHGGRIWIESEKGKGCTVCFTLPARESGTKKPDKNQSGE